MQTILLENPFKMGSETFQYGTIRTGPESHQNCRTKTGPAAMEKRKPSAMNVNHWQTILKIRHEMNHILKH
jgi:hypothetical protein